MDIASDQTERTVPAISMRQALWVMLGATLLGVAGWETWARSQGLEPGYYHDSDALWAIQRRAASTAENPLVIVGSSRAFFDIDLNVWEEVSGERPIQLCIEGTDPRPFLSHLANDPAFNGRVIVGVTPPLFFTGYAERKNTLAYYRDETPSQRLSKRLDMFLEPLFAFHGAGQRDLRLFQLLRRMDLSNREGVPPPSMDIRDISDSDADRNSWLWRPVAEDPALNEATKARWEHLIKSAPKPPPDAPPFDVPGFMASVAPDLAKIRERGGDVVFLRCPSDGFFAGVEAQAFPRALFWDQITPLLGAGSVHYADHPGLREVRIPEWSHIHADDREFFTRTLVPLIEQAFATRSAVR